MSRTVTVLSLICFLLTAGTFQGFAFPMADQSTVETCKSWLRQAQEGIARREYHVSRNSAGLQAPNRASNLRFYFDEAGIAVRDRNEADGPDLLRLSLTSVDRIRNGQTPLQGKTCSLLDNPKVHCRENRVDIEREGLTEWYINTPEGLEQGFTLPARPAGSGDLRLSMRVSAARAAMKDDHIIITAPSGRTLKYSALLVEDGKGRVVPASLEVPDARTINILVQDRDAVYPLTIDPLLNSTPDTFLESDQYGARLGESVSGAGDVNGDGFADVIVGAPNYDNGTTDEGAAFVYHGSPAGVSTTWAVILESNANDANFGCSVSGAGDVNGDGYADVIVGARFYNTYYTKRGAFFVFHGSASGIIPAAATTVQGTQNFAELGDCVSGAGDVNGDGYADVMAGAPYYENGEPEEGVVFVHHGGPTGISPTAATLLESNQASGHMGHELSGAGDINGDGYADVIVNAFDGAYVYHGSSTGVSTTPASSTVYTTSSVSDAGDVNGDGFADVIIGWTGYANGQTSEGGAFIYHGSSTGLLPAAATILESNQTNAMMGSSVSGAGDVNGDGYADVIVGAIFYDSGQADEGAAFVYHGSASGITTTVVAQLESDQAGASMGVSVAGSGDVNGDGFADVIVGAYHYDYGQNSEGAAFIYHGGASSVSPTPAAAVESNQSGGLLGWCVSDAGDVNGDGYGDVVAGAPNYDNGEFDEGVAFVYHGTASGISLTPATMVEPDQAVAGLGYSVSSAGDVNGDGFADILAGAPVFDNGSTDEGAVFVYHGSAAGIVAQAVAVLEPDQDGASHGWSVSGAGDVNGDGFADVIVGTPTFDNGQADEGVVFVYHGSSTGISTTAAAMVEPDQTYTYMGYSVSGAGDVNGDGFADVIVGATSYFNGQVDEGAVFVYHGGTAGISTTPAAMMESNQDYANLGSCVSNAGDVNGDGFADVIAGAWRFDNGHIDEGAAFVYHGSPTGVVTAAAAMVEPDQDWAFMGMGVSGAGDVNGDGYSDVIVGAFSYDNGQIDEGAAFVYHGSSTGISTAAAAMMESDLELAYLGHSVSGAGDVNGDGFADVIVGASNYANGEADEGAVFVYHGNSDGRSVLAAQLRGGSGATPVQPWGLSHDIDDFQVQVIATHPEGRGRVKLQVEYCAPGIPFGDPSCVTVTSAAWTDVTLGSSGVTLTMTIPGLTAGELYRWRCRVLHAPFTVTAPGIVAPFNPSHGPWRRLAAQADEGDIRIAEDVPPAFTLSFAPDPLKSGQSCSFDVTGGAPFTATYLVYSITGTGSTWVPPLNVYLDLDNPKQLGGMKTTDGSGHAAWPMFVPPQYAGIEVWFQALQNGSTTNVKSCVIH